MSSDVENSQVERELRLIWVPQKYSERSSSCAVSSLLDHDVKCIITTLHTKNQRDKKHLQRKNDDINALSAKRVRYDLEAMLSYMQLRGGILQCEV